VTLTIFIYNIIINTQITSIQNIYIFLLYSEGVSNAQMQEEGEKIDFDLLRGWMHIGFRDFVQYIRLVGGIQYTISSCFKS